MAKNVQNLVHCRKTFNFDRDYLCIASRYRQTVNGVINNNSTPIKKKKFGELWSTAKNL